MTSPKNGACTTHATGYPGTMPDIALQQVIYNATTQNVDYRNNNLYR